MPRMIDLFHQERIIDVAITQGFIVVQSRRHILRKNAITIAIATVRIVVLGAEEDEFFGEVAPVPVGASTRTATSACVTRDTSR